MTISLQLHYYYAAHARPARATRHATRTGQEKWKWKKEKQQTPGHMPRADAGEAKRASPSSRAAPEKHVEGLPTTTTTTTATFGGGNSTDRGRQLDIVYAAKRESISLLVGAAPAARNLGSAILAFNNGHDRKHKHAVFPLRRLWLGAFAVHHHDGLFSG